LPFASMDNVVSTYTLGHSIASPFQEMYSTASRGLGGYCGSTAQCHYFCPLRCAAVLPVTDSAGWMAN
jgi:hypothetical protein